MEDYLEALEIFADSIPQKSEKIGKALEDNDFETYTILVHSLKSSARTVGATEISDLARKLEIAGKNKDVSLIRQETPKLLSLYTELGDALENL